MVYESYRRTARKMILAGVEAADPTRAVRNSVRVEGNKLTVQGQEFNLEDYQRVLLLGIGKAASPMAKALEEIITPDDGLIITKEGEEIPDIKLETVPVYRAYHPEPREINVKYSNKVLKMVEDLGPDSPSLIFFLVTGGGSALFCAPPEGISIEEMYRLNQLLMKCGAGIGEINAIRKHLSQVKGGRFGRLCSQRGATTISLLLSDVVGDDMSVIASGPTYKDDTTFKDAINLGKRYNIWEEMPVSIRQYLEDGVEQPSLESPVEIPSRVYNFLIGNNRGALKAAEEVARNAGFNTLILTSQNVGEAKEIARCISGIAKEVQDAGVPLRTPAALIMGGEMVTSFDWEDRDGFGPNREFVLSCALELQGHNNIVVAGADTDGVDGEGKAGAIADCRTVDRAELDAREYLNRHDAEIFFDSLRDSLEFSSLTNVNDIDVVLIGPADK